MFNFNIGADPEFLLFHNNKFAPAIDVIRATYGKKDFPSTSDGYLIKNGTNPAGTFGWDGHNRTGEMRPKQNKDPKEVVANLGKMIESATETMPYLTMTSLSIGNPIGGHIHLELPQDVEAYAKSVTTILGRSDEAIGRMMALYLAPIIASEHRISAAIRLNSGSYGKIHDIRKNRPSDSVQTIEVRGLTAEWTCRPDIALATLTYLGVIWNEILTKGPNAIVRTPLGLKTINQTNSLQTMLLSEYQPVMDAIIKATHQHVKNFELYQENKAAIDLIFDYKKTSKMKEDVGWNISRGWNQEKKTPKMTKRSFMSDTRIKKELKKIDDDAISPNQQNVTYNDDFNMSKFMTALNERITALSLQLENDYFFYGLKKETENFLITRHDMQTKEFDFLTYPKNVKRDDVKAIANKMLLRYTSNYKETKGQLRLDPKTGKNRSSQKTLITFGIPYELRADSDIKLFLAKLWDVERGLVHPTPLTEIPEVIDAKTTPAQEKNKIPQEVSMALEEERTQSFPTDLISTNNF